MTSTLSRNAGLKPISRRDPHPGLPVPAVDLSLPFAPSWTWCPGGQTVSLAGSADCPRLSLVCGRSVGYHSLGAPSAPCRADGLGRLLWAGVER